MCACGHVFRNTSTQLLNLCTKYLLKCALVCTLVFRLLFLKLSCAWTSEFKNKESFTNPKTNYVYMHSKITKLQLWPK